MRASRSKRSTCARRAWKAAAKANARNRRKKTAAMSSDDNQAEVWINVFSRCLGTKRPF